MESTFRGIADGFEASTDLSEKENLYENIRVTLKLGNAFSVTDRKTRANVAKTCCNHKIITRNPRTELVFEVLSPVAVARSRVAALFPARRIDLNRSLP